MLTTRLWMGSLLVLLALGVLILDRWLAPWYPILLVTALGSALLASHELVRLLPAPRPRAWVCFVGVAALILANWPAYLWQVGTSWLWVAGTVAGALLMAFLAEGVAFYGPSGAVIRLSLTFWIIGYLGLLPSFLVQLRWFAGWHSSVALALAIFVPKFGDIGAYFTGRYLGRHRMAPILSPKKTWEGAVGGLAASVGVALGINALGARFADGPLLTWRGAAGFGLAVGIVAMLGDLMESMIKRDSARKDASDLVPGFGGMLDVLDSILFSAPVAYLWIISCGLLPLAPG